MSAALRFRKKPVEITASQWFKNGDHPNDYDDEVMPDGSRLSSADQRARDYEGQTVRRFRRPDVDGQSACPECGRTFHEHGWIDTLEDGHRVCPGDWIITGVKGERYPCKPDIFEATYDRVEGS
jgi:hypothetical protein